MRKRLNFIILVLMLLAVAITLVACKNSNLPSSNGDSTLHSVSISTAVDDIYAGFIAVNESSESSSYISVTFGGKYLDDNGKNCEYSFVSCFDITESALENGDTYSKMAFSVKRESTDILKIYLTGGTLYIERNPVLADVKYPFEAAPLVSKLNTSYNGAETLFNIICKLPTLAENILSSAYLKEYPDNSKTYTLLISYSKALSYLPTFIKNINCGLTYDNLLGLLGTSESSLTAAASIDGKDLGVVVKLKSNGNFDYLGIVEDTDKIEDYDGKESFTLKNLSVISGIEEVSLPTNLETYKTFDFANISMSGVLTVNGLSGTGKGDFFVDSTLSTSLIAKTQKFDYIFRSSRLGGGGIEFLFDLKKQGEDKNISLYSDGLKVYFNFSDYGIEPFSLDVSYLDEKLLALGIKKVGDDLDYKAIVGIVGELLASRTENNSLVTYSLSQTALENIRRKLGYDSILEYSSISATFNTKDKEFGGLNLTFKAYNTSFSFDCVGSNTNPLIFGTNVDVVVPVWITTAVDYNSASTFTPVIEGVVKEATSAPSDLSLLESFIYSLSGENVTLTSSKSNSLEYRFSANLNSLGSLTALKLDFFSSLAREERICTLYFDFADENHFYLVGSPNKDGISEIKKLNLVAEGDRYTAFVGAINGNVLDEYGAKEWSFSNVNGYDITANRYAINSLLKVFGEFAPSFRWKSLPYDLTLSSASLLINDGTSLKVTFGDSKYITFQISSVSMGHNSIEPISISAKSRAVSIYDENNMDKSTEVTMGDGSVYKVSLLDEKGKSSWTYSSIPNLDSGKVDVTAYVTILGKKLSTTVNVDTTSCKIDVIPSLTKLDESVYKNYVFSFDRYDTSVNPIQVITSLNTARLTNGAVKPITWYDNKGHNLLTDGIGGVTPNTLFLKIYVTGFFTKPVEVSATHNFSVNITGNDIKTATAVNLVNGNIFDNMAANGGKLKAVFSSGATKGDPYDAAAYGTAITITFGDNGSILYNSPIFDVSNINVSNISSAAFGSTEKPSLDTALYNCKGSYSLPVTVTDSFGNSYALTYTVNVAPNVISDINFNEGELSEGLSIDRTNGLTFLANPVILEKISANILPSSVICMASDANYYTSTTIKWDISDIEGVTMTNGKSGKLALIIGNSVGGYQRFSIPYKFIKVTLNSVALLNAEGDEIFAESSNGVGGTVVKEQTADVEGKLIANFDMLNLNPYSYSHPSKVLFKYTLQDSTHLEYAERVNWSYDKTFNPTTLWTKDDTYLATYSKSGFTVKVTLAFKQKGVDDTKAPRFAWVNESKNIIASYPEGDITYYITTSSSGVETGCFNFNSYGAIDPTKAVDYTNVEKYPSYVTLTFKDKSTATLKVVWDISVFDDATNIASNGYNGTITGKILIAKDNNGNNLYGQSITVRVYIVPGATENIYTGATVQEESLSGSMLNGSFSSSLTYSAIIAAKNNEVLTLTNKEKNALAGNTENDMNSTIAVLKRIIKNAFYATSSPSDYLVDIITAALSEGYISGISKTLTFSVLTYDEVDKKVITVNPCNTDNYPKYLYFDYPDTTGIADNMFKVAEWDLKDENGNNKINRFFFNALQNNPNLALQDIETIGGISVTAEVGNNLIGYIRTNISVVIVPTFIQNLVLTDIPYAASSAIAGGNDRYSMAYTTVYTADSEGEYVYDKDNDTYIPYDKTRHQGVARYSAEFFLTVNPYITDPTLSGGYPAAATFLLNSLYDVKLDIAWDLTNLNPKDLYKGSSPIITAYIDIGLYGGITIPVTLIVEEKTVEKVKINNSDFKTIYIDPYGQEPFGSLTEGDEVYVNVSVKFYNDDNYYPLSLRYNKAGIELDYKGGTVKNDLVVYVGNNSGGWQKISNYTLVAYPRTLTEVKAVYYLCDTCLKVGGKRDICGMAGCQGTSFTLQEKKMYELSIVGIDAITTFYDVDFSLPLPDTLKVTYSNGDSATLYSSVIEMKKGATFNWSRKNDHLVLNIWSLAVGNDTDTNQIIEFVDATGYASLETSMFKRWEEIKNTTFGNQTAGEYILAVNVNSVVDGVMDYLKVHIARWIDSNEDGIADNNELTVLNDNDIMGAGKYLFVAGLVEKEGGTHPLYGVSNVSESFVVFPRNIDNYVKVLQGISIGTYYEATYGLETADDILTATVMDIPGVVAGVKYYLHSDTEHLNPIDFSDITKVPVGVYDYIAYTDNPNYEITSAGSYTDGTFEIKPQLIKGISVIVNGNQNEFIITKGTTPTIVVNSEKGVLTNTVDLVYYSIAYFVDADSDGILDNGEEVTIDTLDMGGHDTRDIRFAIILNSNYTTNEQLVYGVRVVAE